MGTLAKIMPLILSLLGRTRVLGGILSSRTSGKQALVALPAAFVVIVISHFAPDILPQEYQETIGLVVAGLLASLPWVMRLMGYKEPLASDDDKPASLHSDQLSDVFMCYVYGPEGSWKPFIGNGFDAYAAGYKYAADENDWIWHLESGTKTDVKRPERKSTDAESSAAVKKAIELVKARLAEIKKGE